MVDPYRVLTFTADAIADVWARLLQL